jgi:AraC family transcriptional regulator
VEVSDLSNIPGIFFAKTLPASKYAVFTAKEGLTKLHDTFQYAYNTWLPASEYEVAYPFDFEYYGERYQGDTPESEVDIYIPIKPKV